MMLSLGQFVFGLNTLAFEEMQRQMAWRHAENARVGAAPALQYLGPEATTITLTGAQVPEIGDRSSLATLTAMASTGAAYAMADGAGTVYGAFVIESIQLTGTHFIAEGLPRKTTFNIALKSTDPERADPSGGADDNAGSGWDFDAWDWWLGS